MWIILNVECFFKTESNATHYLELESPNTTLLKWEVVSNARFTGYSRYFKLARLAYVLNAGTVFCPLVNIVKFNTSVLANHYEFFFLLNAKITTSC